MSSNGFDKNRHFVFLRDYEEHTLLISVNFANTVANIKVVLPQHAFDWMGIPVNDDLYPGKEIEVSVQPMDGTVITLI